MTVSFELPNEIEHELRVAFGDLGKAAKDALLIDAYRQGQMSVGRLAEILNLSADQVHHWLADHNVPINYSADELRADVTTLKKLFPNG